jgi:probable F420-dependent oxidoreductase
MPHPRRFRFAVQLNRPYEGRTWTDSVKELEDLGYSTLFMPDHLDSGYGPLAGMTAALAATTTLKVGPLVLDCDFRHPAMVTRDLATMHLISDGRLEVGLGAGWKATDYQWSGIAMDRPGVRVDRMIEHAEIMRRLFTGDAVTFHGEHYHVTDLVLDPPVPDPPPFIIGGGARRVLNFAGSFADIVGVNPSIHSGQIDADSGRDALADRIDQKMAWVREGAGDRFGDLELNAWTAVAMVTTDPEGLAAKLAPGFGLHEDPATLLESPMVLLGDVDGLADELHRRRDRWGYSYHVIGGDTARDFGPLVTRLTGT